MGEVYTNLCYNHLESWDEETDNIIVPQSPELL